MNRIFSLAGKSSRVVIGVNSGTSADGVDALCVRITGGGFHQSHQVLGSASVPYPRPLRLTLQQAPNIKLEHLTRLHKEIGERFAEAACAAAGAAGLAIGDVDIIGSHGQTVCHLPDPKGLETATFQIGDIDVIAERTGVVTVGDFRARDVAAGGEGAPLVPFLDWLLFRERPRTICLNIGGISNITVVQEDLEGCRAFDTGPGNMPLDLLASRITQGAEAYDPGGRIAESGRVSLLVLEQLLLHPYLHRPPPKSTGREEFGASFVETLELRHGGGHLEDLLATLTCFVARATSESVRRHVQIDGGPREVVVSGGGVRNVTLMRHLKEAFFPVPVTSSADHGIPPDQKEALLFAVLANERILGNASNVPAATGARWPVGLGKIAL